MLIYVNEVSIGNVDSQKKFTKHLFICWKTNLDAREWESAGCFEDILVNSSLKKNSEFFTQKWPLPQLPGFKTKIPW